jgi:serine/tyrosine/threonine adenylyltransferase
MRLKFGPAGSQSLIGRLTIPDLVTADGIRFDNSYTRLPERFYARLAPTRVANPQLIRVNKSLAELLGIDPDALASPDGVAFLAGNRVPAGADPIAMAYAGHQFGGFVPQLGDGRAILLGEVVGRDGVRRDIQLKGSGPTPFSRRGDGRAALGPVLREYIVSEAMAELGVPTTRSLAAVATGETVRREVPLPGGVLTRVASSHIRIGTFQYFAARGDTNGVRTLADYVISRHYRQATAAGNPYRALLESVISCQAELVSRWLHVGFIHGVMNTDNMSIAGETIDYGPCAFMDAYHPGAVFSSIDEMGRYAYGNQPSIAQWNLARLSETLLPLLADDQEAALAMAQESLRGFATQFNAAYAAGLGRKLGLVEMRDGDLELGQDLLARMAAGAADFTVTFRALSDAAVDPQKEVLLREQFADPSAMDEWLPRWRKRVAEEDGDPAARATIMRANNPAVIPRNHLIEEAIAAAVERSDFEPFHAMVNALCDPYTDRPGRERYATPPRPEEIVHQTFCGT